MKFYVGGHYPDGGINPLSESTLKDLLMNNGLEIVENPDEADCYIANNFSVRDDKILKKFSVTKRILLISEPEVVLPDNFKEKNRRMFGLIISDDVRNENEYLRRGQFFDRQVPKSTVHTRLPRAILINANKLSLIKNNNYGFRKRAAGRLEFVDLFGYGWNQSLFTRIKILIIELRNSFKNKKLIEIRSIIDWLRPLPKSNGSIKAKHEAMNLYMFSLIVENQDTYISEKIFDSFFSGCIPIYIGPDLSKHAIPKELYIQARKDLKSLEDSFQEIKQLDYENWLQLLLEWLTDAKTMQYWGEDHVVTEMARLIKSYMKI